MDFRIDPRLEADTLPVGDLPLSRVLLMDDSRFPWLVLVPRRDGASEITDLDDADGAALMGEIRLASSVLAELARPDAVHVAAFGTGASQLHVHVVGRFLSDPAWPGPAWGHGTRLSYPAHAAAALADRAGAAFAKA